MNRATPAKISPDFRVELRNIYKSARSDSPTSKRIYFTINDKAQNFRLPIARYFNVKDYELLHVSREIIHFNSNRGAKATYKIRIFDDKGIEQCAFNFDMAFNGVCFHSFYRCYKVFSLVPGYPKPSPGGVPKGTVRFRTSDNLIEFQLVVMAMSEEWITDVI